MHMPSEGRPLVASPATRQLLVVAGSGRSGTSLFTGLTGRLGFHIPKPEVRANRSNPRGFGEPRWVVDFHNELLASTDVTVEDGRPEAWHSTDAVAADPVVRQRLGSWLEAQFDQADRVVVKDPRLAWFIELYRASARDLDADLRVVTMLRHPAAVMRSREIAYGKRSSNTTRVIGWANMMLGIETRTRDLPRATIRYDDLLLDWRRAFSEADALVSLDLLDDPQQVTTADELVDPSLRRSVAEWSELGLTSTTLELAERLFTTYDGLVGVPAHGQTRTRADLDALGAQFTAYYDECFEVSRSRTGARVRQERRKAARRLRAEEDSAPGGSVAGTARGTTQRVMAVTATARNWVSGLRGGGA